jgi:amino acid adenylation domain-containing protein
MTKTTTRLDSRPDSFRHHDSTIAAAFADTAARHAERAAVLTAPAIPTQHGRPSGPSVVSYAELAAMAGGIAVALPPGERVGLLLDHGVDMIAAMLGTLAAGRCYVPLDPTYPPPQLRAMCAQADLAAILTHRRHRELAIELAPAPVIDIGQIPRTALKVNAVDPRQPAYILFTSGSTGRPKGVVHNHRSVLHGVGNHVSNLRIGPADRTSLLTSFSFDMSVSDLYSAVLSGAGVVPFDLRAHGFDRLAAVLTACDVTIYHSTPTVFRYLTDTMGPDGRLPNVRVAVLGGEEVNRTDLRNARTHFGTDCLFVNGYGATEASFAVQNHIRAGADVVGVPDREVVPIGSALPGYEILLLGERDSVGEIAIRSDYLAIGYWGDPQQTAAAFSADGTLYRTGDVARRLPDGQLVYLGRADRQVKVRGHRVELGEVEAHLAALPGVARAVAVATTSGDDGAHIYAYAQPAGDVQDLDAATLRSHLAGRVPDFLVPRRIMVVGELPQTTTGKVDLNELPAVVYEPASTDSSPSGDREVEVARVWCEVLDLPDVGRHVGFFDAGGNSLALTRLQRRLAQTCGTAVTLRSLLEHPTVAGMARLLSHAPDSSPPTASAELTDRMARRRAARGGSS